MSFDPYSMRDYNPRVGTRYGRVKSEDFSIDGRSWDYRDPYNQEQIDKQNINREKGRRDTISNNAYTKANPLYDYSFGQVRDAAAALGIDNVDKGKEVRQIIKHIQNPTPTTTAAPETPKKNKNKNKSDDARLAAPTEPVNTVLSKEAREANAFVAAHNEMTIGNSNPLAGIAVSNQAGVSSPEAGAFKNQFQLKLGGDGDTPLTFTEGSTGTKPTVATGFIDKYKDAIKQNLEPI